MVNIYYSVYFYRRIILLVAADTLADEGKRVEDL